MRRGYVDIPEGQIHYRFGGSGKSLLLIHQTPASSDDYRDVMPILAKHYYVVAMDSMGYGLSDPPPRDFEIPDYAHTVTEFLAALDIKKVSVLGHHTGATIALELAASYPAMVDRLILSAFPYYDPEERAQRLQNPSFRPLHPVEDGSHLMERWNKLRRDAARAGPDNWTRALMYRLMPGGGDKAAYYAVFHYDEQRRLPLVKAPTLLLCGTDDMFYGRLEATAKLLSHCVTRTIPNGDGLAPVTAPEAFAQNVLDFLGTPESSLNK